MATIKQYYNAVISDQNETWHLMYTNAVYALLPRFDQHPRGRAMARKCAGVFTRCYNAIFFGTYEIELENICIPDAIECVRECFEYRRITATEKEVIATAHLLYDSLFPDAETGIHDVEEYI